MREMNRAADDSGKGPDVLALSDASSVRAVLFDFDGTLADSYPAITATVNHLREMRGLEPLPVEGVRPHVGRGLPHLLGAVLPGWEPDELSRQYRAHHPGVMRAGTTLLPGARETLDHLRARGLQLGVCSNKPLPLTRALMEHLGAVVDLVLGPEDVPRPKPAPDMLLMALDRLQLAAEQALYVGDMVVDIEAARGAGMPVWVVPTGSDSRAALQQAGPDRLLERLSELMESFV